MIVKKFSGLSSTKLFNTWGGTRLIEDNIKFQEDVKNLLETPLGSIPGNPTFGSNLFKFLYMNVTTSLGALIQQEVRDRLESNYPDILVDSVDVILERRAVKLTIGMNNSNSNVITYINLELAKEET